jgi:CheY-like chemotaxis protein
MVSALDKRAPVILLIEDDETERMRLGGMLMECGYGVMAAGRAADALDIFVIHHLSIALVLSTERLSDSTRAQRLDAFSRIDSRVPVVTRHANHYSTGRQAFADVIGEVQQRLQGISSANLLSGRRSVARTKAPASGDGVFFEDARPRHSFGQPSETFTWPLRDEDVEAIERADAVAPVERISRLESIEVPELRTYLDALDKARRDRWQRIGRIGITVVAGAALFVATLLQLSAMAARAF